MLLVTVLRAARFVISCVGSAVAGRFRIRKTGRAGCLSRRCSLGAIDVHPKVRALGKAHSPACVFSWPRRHSC